MTPWQRLTKMRDEMIADDAFYGFNAAVWLSWQAFVCDHSARMSWLEIHDRLNPDLHYSPMIKRLVMDEQNIRLN